MAYKRTTTTEILDREFRALDIPYKVEKTRGQHLRWSFSHGGTKRSLIAASTPSDWRAPRAARAQLRPLVKSIDAIETNS
jgi:hypothetical protein